MHTLKKYGNTMFMQTKWQQLYFNKQYLPIDYIFTQIK